MGRYPGHGQERINAAFELGGSQTAKQTTSNVLGQRVDRYALIGLQGVRDVVDAVGGVDITVAQAIHDDAYPTDDYGIQTVDIPAGRQHMDGDTALKYARTRHQDSDFGRIARQQQVLSAVRTALFNPLNWPRIPAVAAAVQPVDPDRRQPARRDRCRRRAAATRAIRTTWSSTRSWSIRSPATAARTCSSQSPSSRPAVARFLGGSTATVLVDVSERRRRRRPGRADRGHAEPEAAF